MDENIPWKIIDKYFKDNPQAAAFALEDYKKGLRSMRSNLLDPAPSYFKDDRITFI